MSIRYPHSRTEELEEITSLTLPLVYDDPIGEVVTDSPSNMLPLHVFVFERETISKTAHSNSGAFKALENGRVPFEWKQNT